MTTIHSIVDTALRRPRLIVIAVSCVVFFSPNVLPGQGTNGEAWVAPDRAAHRTNPVALDKGSIKSGQQLYEANCQKCHGKAGRGDGPQAQFLDTPPADLTSQAARDESDGALFWKMSEGRGRMLKVNLKENDRWMLVHYIRMLQRKP